MDNAIENFKAFTGASDEIALRYLSLTENVPEQAIQLYFDTPDLASSLDQPNLTSDLNPLPTTQRKPLPENDSRPNDDDIINLDSDEETSAIDKKRVASFSGVNSARGVTGHEDDESIARRIQAELYAGSSSISDDIRAPIGRRTETLVGGPGSEWEEDGMQSAVMQQMRTRSHARPGVFNQAPVPSIWDQNSDATTRRQGLAEATGGASETSSKATRLAELFRPPFELMRQVPWDVARDQGKEEGKWILVNVQDQSIFDCQQLNRDIWKDPGIKNAVKEHFIFVQYSKNDPRGIQYMQYYFPNKDNDAAYPHIAIIDPRTGELVKIWSGRPVLQASDFLIQIYEFLDRYSLDFSKKNPVANRKPEITESINVDRLTEEEMLELALQNSLSNCAESENKGYHPDHLTKDEVDMVKGKGKEIERNPIDDDQTSYVATSSPASVFSQISSKNPHTQPALGPGATRILFRHASGRVVRIFKTDDLVRRIYEWLKSEPIEGKTGIDFELKAVGMNIDLIDRLDETIETCGLKNGTIMVEFVQADDDD
ncbi:hypothetical protein K3495_g6849 [Podosphaera aphanis]|nr:hypothetical protein K3495_g6849 [Podosphaera aphanis]